MSFWEKLKEDLQLGMKEGWDAIKAGAETVKDKAGELTDEGKKKYKVYTLKRELKDQMAELGARIYTLALAKPDLLNDAAAMFVMDKIKKLEEEIKSLEKA